MKLITALLTVLLSLGLAAAAHPSADVAPPRGPQGLPGPGPVAPPPEATPPRGPQGLPGPGPSPQPVDASSGTTPTPSDGGMSAFAIMLVSVGGALALTGVAYVVTRTALHRRARVDSVPGASEHGGRA